MFAKLGGKLGGQVSDSDVKFVQQMAGSTTTDAAALKRLLAIAAVQDLRFLSRYNADVQDISKSPGFEYLARYAAPSHFLGAEVDPEVDQMMQNVFAGKPAVVGATPLAPSPGAPARPGVAPAPAPVIQWGARRGR